MRLYELDVLFFDDMIDFPKSPSRIARSDMSSGASISVVSTGEEGFEKLDTL